MSKKNTLTTLSIVGTAFVASLAASNVATAQESDANPFAMKELSSGYMQMAKEGKCGGSMKKSSEDGKCGGSMKKSSKDGKCGGSMKKGAKDGKCGEGKCGDSMKGMKGTKEGKCGGSKNKMKEGKCGGN